MMLLRPLETGAFLNIPGEGAIAVTETDWQKTYVLGWNFYLKRLIISKLAGMGNYDRICAFVNDYYTSRFDDPEYGQKF